MTDAEIINAILVREGENGPNYEDAADRGGRTSWGISELAHPEAWVNGPPTREQAYAIYEKEYVAPWQWVPDAPLRALLIDWYVNSSPSAPISALQGAVGAEIDGVVGRQTKFKTLECLARPGGPGRLYNDILSRRCEHFLRLALDEPAIRAFLKAHPKAQLNNLRGWIRGRVLSFLKS